MQVPQGRDHPGLHTVTGATVPRGGGILVIPRCGSTHPRPPTLPYPPGFCVTHLSLSSPQVGTNLRATASPSLSRATLSSIANSAATTAAHSPWFLFAPRWLGHPLCCCHCPSRHLLESQPVGKRYWLCPAPWAGGSGAATQCESAVQAQLSVQADRGRQKGSCAV